MNKNFSDSNSIRRKKNERESNSINFLSNSKDEDDNENIILLKKSRRNRKNNSNQRYLSPILSRYTTAQSYNRKSDISNSKLAIDNSFKINIPPDSNTSQEENDEDSSYYKNLYIQTKNNLKKEKQKNDENQKNILIISNLKSDNKMLKDKIKTLTSQLDRVIDLAEKSNNQNLKNMNIKQEEINKLNTKIESLVENSNLIQIKSRQEKESLENTINKLNSDNQNTQLTIKNYQNKIEHISQVSNSEINTLKERILSLNEDLALCINEKNKLEQKDREIINELKERISENFSIENKRLKNELNDYKNHYNELKMNY